MLRHAEDERFLHDGRERVRILLPGVCSSCQLYDERTRFTNKPCDVANSFDAIATYTY